MVAFDKTAQKVERVEENATKWGVTCVEAYYFDARNAVDAAAGIE